MPISISTAEGDAVRSTDTDYGNPPFSPDSVTAAQIQTYATNTITNIAGAVTAWIVLAKFAIWLYRKQKQANTQLAARIAALEKK